MAKPIDARPQSSTEAFLGDGTRLEDDLEAIVQALDEAGVLSFLRALLEQRQPLADRLMEKINSEPTRRGLKTLVTLTMGLGALPENSGSRLIAALEEALAQGEVALKSEDADKMSIWALIGLLKDPDIARGVRYLAGLLKGLGAFLGAP